MCVQQLGRHDNKEVSCDDVTKRQAEGSQPVRVRSGETPRSPVAKPPCVVERPGAKRGGATDQSAT